MNAHRKLRFTPYGPAHITDLLLTLNNALEIDKVLPIAFLCEDELNSVNCTSFREPRDVFQFLHDKGCIGDYQTELLAEILWRIGRLDLVKKYLVEIPDEDSRVRFKKYIEEKSHFSPYRLLLHDLCEGMTDWLLSKMKSLPPVRELSKKEKDGIKTPEQLFILMGQRDYVSPNNLEQLITMIEQTGDKELWDILIKHKHARPVTRRNIIYTSEPVGPGRIVTTLPPRENGISELPRYKMSATPRGICLLINNLIFDGEKRDPYGKKLKNREGSKKDEESIIETFSNLGFTVLTYRDLTSVQMEKAVYKEGKMKDHTNYDCFACVVLTHGSSNAIYGSDGMPVEIRQLTNFVKPESAPSLTGKPKLFFIQACQGSDRQEGFSEDSDIETDNISLDASIPGLVPNEADIVVSYATVPGFVSYRSKTTGSFYINALCECLEKHARSHDLMTILTSVNSLVSKKTFTDSDGKYTQIPQPQMTLRKLLYL